MKKYLVTGGAGFIGSHICERIVKDGGIARILDNFSSGKKENIAHLPSARLEVLKGDIRDKSACRKAVSGVDYVLHQAALRSVPKSFNCPEDYNEVNISGTLNLLQASVKAKAGSFVFASSSSVYGNTDYFPEKENFSPGPISPYALSKLAGEYYCKIFTKFYGLKTFSLRYFNVFGPRQALDDDYAVVIPKFITCIINGSHPPVHGDGKQTRDFTYVGNVVDANILAAHSKKGAGEVFNVGNNREHSVLELAKEVNKILGKNIRPVFSPTRIGDVRRTLADISKAGKILGYKPGFSFEGGLVKTVEYFLGK